MILHNFMQIYAARRSAVRRTPPPSIFFFSFLTFWAGVGAWQSPCLRQHDICHMMWPTMRRTVAIAFVVQGHDYGTSRIRIQWAFIFFKKLRSSHNLCKVQNVAAKSRFLHFSFVFLQCFVFFINNFLAKKHGQNHWPFRFKASRILELTMIFNLWL